MDKAGNFFFANVATHTIQKMTPQGVLTTIAGTGQPGLTNGLAPLSRFNGPSGIAIDKSGNIFVADVNNVRIRKIQ
jgi:hypothetical protein